MTKLLCRGNHDEAFKLIKAFESTYWEETAERNRIGDQIFKLLDLEKHYASALKIYEQEPPRKEGYKPPYMNKEFSIGDCIKESKALTVWYDPKMKYGNWKYVFVLNSSEALPND